MAESPEFPTLILGKVIVLRRPPFQAQASYVLFALRFRPLAIILIQRFIYLIV